MNALAGFDWLAELTDAPSGFDVSTRDREQVERQAGAGASTYGELLPASARRLLAWLALGADDAFFDLGSGSGRLVIQSVFETSVGRAVGVELSRDRHDAALAAVGRLGLTVGAIGRSELAARLELRHADLRETDVSDATVVYVAATSFPPALLSETCRILLSDAPRLRRLVTTRALPAPWNRRFRPIGELDLDATWSRDVRVHVHSGAR